MYDVVISGAGPSGSYCAKVISQAGYNVALIEKDTNWRKPCGGAVHSSVINLYPELIELERTKIQGVVMHSADFHILEFKGSSEEYSIIMDRLELDNIMRKSAVDTGVHLFDKNLSIDFIRKGLQIQGIKTRTPHGVKEYRAKIVIIADGMSSKLAQKSGLRSKWNINELALGKCSILEGSTQLDKEYVYVFFQPFKGYGWIFPLSKTRFNIGIFTFGEDNLNYNINELYQDFLNSPQIKNYIPESNYKTIWSGSYPFPAEGVLEKSLYEDNLMLIGDTAGFISPISGEGIQTAVISGRVAAKTAIDSLEKADYSRNILKKFKTNLEIKNIIRNFKLKRSMIEFFFEKEGQNLNKMLQLTESDPIIKEQVVNMFAFGDIPSKDLISKIIS